MKKIAALALILSLASPAFAADKTPGPAAKETAKAAAQASKPIIDGKDAKMQKAAQKKQAPVQQTQPPARVQQVNYVGEIETYKARGDDTLLSIGERENLGYVELRSANPAMDPWHPGNGTFVILPKMHLLPDAPRKGIVINLSEMRTYFYQKDGTVKSFPIGVGREGFSTPLGTTTVVSKTRDPSWRPTDRMLREDPTLKPFYGPGPDNPLGHYALYLGWPQYRMHGTNKPWGIGRRVSSGCIRMYDESVEYLFEHVPVGTTVTTVRQPIKFGWIGDMLYIEAHPDEMLADQVERVGGAPLDYKVPGDLFSDLSRAAGKARDNIDWKAVREALRDRRGYPVPILQGATEENQFVTTSMIERAGTSRFGPRLTDEPLEPLTPGMTTVEQTPANAQETPVRRRSVGFNG